MKTLTARNREILSVLSLRVRLASLRQIAHTWWDRSVKPDEAALASLSRIRSAGLIRQMLISAINLPKLAAPLATWSPGEYTPDLGALAWILHCRFRVAPQPTTVFMAMPRCAQLFGGKRTGKISRAFQVSHDLGVTEMFLAVQSTAPAIIPHWIDEDRFALSRKGEKLPDAVIARDIASLPSLVLEFGGDYSKSRLQAFHEDNESRGLPYQIW